MHDLITCLIYLFTTDIIPPQVFNCPKEDARGSEVATIGGKNFANWNTISAFNLDGGATPAYSSISQYGQTTSTQFPYGFTTVGYAFIDNPVPPGPANIALCRFFVAIPGESEVTNVTHKKTLVKKLISDTSIHAEYS